MKSYADRARNLADPDRRQWTKAADLRSDLEMSEVADRAQELIDAIEQFQSALDDKEGAQESETGEELRGSLALAWEQASEAMEQIADALDALNEIGTEL